MYSVLLVDDEPLAIEGLRMFVDWERLGFRVCGVCENGVEAVSAARRLLPDVIVTDIRMPEMDGLELIGRLHGGPGASSEFIVLSAYGEFSFAKRAMQLGVRHYMMKPVVEEEAAKVLTQVRGRLDTRKAIMLESDTESDEEGANLPTHAAHRMKELVQAIEDADSGRAADIIDDLFRELAGCPSEWAELFAGSMAVQCSKLIRGMGGDPALLHRVCLNSAQEKAEPSELPLARTLIRTYAEQAIRSVRSLRGSHVGGTMAEVDQFVRDHYRSPLSIRDVAARFYLNPVYLGKAYQDKFGSGLLDRMHDLRIAEACEKLLGTTEAIGVIAEQVGYAYYGHFLQHFERRTGCKPADFRASER
ncbi:response regulator transcription factor [Cohnella panacarvi]|uniref:response regulator transcription factor n=1 Tax=Cohnella panacarvi TaxID=400776 RepID=UPI00047A6B63|nr:response regulator [Cohnella panacarvi]